MALDPAEGTKVRSLINLLDYIAKDYRLAVKDGVVINEFEYAEMLEFSQNAQDLFDTLNKHEQIDFNPTLRLELSELQRLIKTNAEPNEVGETADFIRDEIVSLKLVSLAPNAWPDLDKGALIFAQQCASCHGVKGDGKGAAGMSLTPSPTDFTDPAIYNSISPLQAFNTITLGIEGTGMRAFNELKPKEVWDLSFYILSISQPEPKKTQHHSAITLEQIALLNNDKLKDQFPQIDIALIRTTPPADGDNYLGIAKNFLEQAESAAINGEFEPARSYALKAYLQGIEPVEPRIKASDNQLFQDLEAAMMEVRATIKAQDPAAMKAAFNNADLLIDKAENILGASGRSMWMTAMIALSILLREGLEAFFVILAILGILQSMGAKRAVKWVHSGWIVATLCGVGGWFFADALMQWDAQSRELMEGLIALIAVAVLLYLGFWMHGKTNASKWKAFVESRIKGMITQNNMIGLASFSFLVVFREAFESVLFLSSLTADGQSSSSMGVLIGSILSALLLFVFAWSMLRWFKKLPIHKVFFYSSLVVLALAFILAGEGIHAIQEGGYMDIRSFPINVRFSLIGLYPTYETILTQLGVLVLIIFLWRWSSTKSTTA